MPKTEPAVSVIVLNYNGANYVKRCLESLFRNHYSNFEVLFVDNNSPDKSVNIAKQLFGNETRLKIIENKQNLGFSVGNNIGFKLSRAKYVISLNNDTEVQENFISTLVAFAELNSAVASVGCKTIQLDNTIQYGPVYMSYGFITHVQKPETYDKATVNLANCGCAVLFRKSALEEVGGFDPYLWTDWEDHDLGFRLNSAGYKCVYTPKTTVLHLGGGNYLGISRERRTRIIRNRMLCYYKNYQTKSLIGRFPVLVLKILSAESLYSFRKGEMPPLIAGFRGFLKLIGPISMERKKIRLLRKVEDKIIFQSCIIPEQQHLWRTLRRL
jgi:GT2 family glycosyltransferase